MVEISLSGSGEGAGWVTGRRYSTKSFRPNRNPLDYFKPKRIHDPFRTKPGGDEKGWVTNYPSVVAARVFVILRNYSKRFPAWFLYRTPRLSVAKEVCMGSLIRWIQPNQVYELTMRTVDRQFLFAPNHHPKNPLIADTCPINALNMNNDIIPESSIINTVGSSIGRALKNYPVQLHSFELNINHPHEQFSVTEEQRPNLPGFLRSAHSLIARGVNRIWERLVWGQA